jgi:hypothetical protein
MISASGFSKERRSKNPERGIEEKGGIQLYLNHKTSLAERPVFDWSMGIKETLHIGEKR